MDHWVASWSPKPTFSSLCQLYATAKLKGWQSEAKKKKKRFNSWNYLHSVKLKLCLQPHISIFILLGISLRNNIITALWRSSFPTCTQCQTLCSEKRSYHLFKSQHQIPSVMYHCLLSPGPKYREKVASGVVEGRSFAKLIDIIILALSTWFSPSSVSVA